DVLEFFFLTPLPGSEDHQVLVKKGVAVDADMNKYDLNHVCTSHPNMSKEEWERTYRMAWETYYTKEHVEAVLRRLVAKRASASGGRRRRGRRVSFRAAQTARNPRRKNVDRSVGRGSFGVCAPQRV